MADTATRSVARRLLVSHGVGATAAMAPWPALLAATWEGTHSDRLLGVVGACRLAPFVLCSTLGGALADRLPRVVLVRWTSVLRALLLTGCAVAAALGQLVPAVILATLAVAIATPAYPALVATVPALGGTRPERLTALLVTVEVSSFVAGPAIGGLLVAVGGCGWATGAAAVLATCAVGPLIGLGQPARAPAVSDGRRRLAGVLRSTPGVRRALGVMMLVNALQAAAAVTLVQMSSAGWQGDAEVFGWATAALGLGTLAAPVVAGRASPARRLLPGLAIAYALVASAPGLLSALLPLAFIGASSTAIEVVATRNMQTVLPDHLRAVTLGLANSLMVAVSLAGAFTGPVVAAGPWGPRSLFGLLALAALTGLVGRRQAGALPRPVHQLACSGRPSS